MKSLRDKVNVKLNRQGGFLKAVSVLAGGTALAQIISILILPILTRIYTPEDFSVFAIFTSLLGAIVVVSCLRFEIAIPIPKKDKTAVNLILLSLISNIFTTILLIIFLYFFKENIFSYINNPEFNKFIWLIPIGFFLAGLYNTFQFWHTRKKNFKIISKTRIYQSITSSLIQISMGVLGVGALGLIVGQIFTFIAGLGLLFSKFKAEGLICLKKTSIDSIVYDFNKYDKFPKYSTFEALAHSSSMHLPIVIIGLFLIGPEAGYILLAMKVMSIPMNLIGSAVAQVYLANAQDYNHNKQLFNYSLYTVKKMFIIGIIPISFIGCGAYLLSGIIFGSEWIPVGKIAMYLIPAVFMQLIASPITMGLHIIEKQKIAMILHFFGFFIRVIGLLWIGSSSVKYMLEYFIISSFFFYFFYLIATLLVIYKNEVRS